MEAFYPVLSFLQILELILKPILYVAVIYILFGPLRKLIKAALINLDYKKSNVQDIVINNSESIIQEAAEEVIEEN